MKVKSMIVISAILFAVCPIIICAVLARYLVTSNANSRLDAMLNSMASNSTPTLQVTIDTAKGDIASLANYEAVKEAASQGSSTAESTDYIKRFIEEKSYISEVSLADSSGNIILGTNAGSTIEDFNKYSEYQDDTFYFDDVANATNSVNTVMFIKEKIGSCTLFVKYDISTSKTILHNITSSSEFYVSNNTQGAMYIVDSRGNYSAGTVINSDLQSRFSSNIANLISSLSDDSVSAIQYYTYSGTRYAAAVANAGGENGLSVIVTCPDNKVNVYYNSAIIPIVVIGIILTLLSVGISFIVASSITKPLKAIENTLEKIRLGDHEARISNMATNEYGQLSRAFNNLVDEIVISEDRYRVISEMSDNIIFEWNFKTNKVIFSNNFNKEFSYRAPSDHFGDSFLLKAKIHPDDVNRYRSDLDGLEKGRNFERNEYRIKNIYGDFIWVLMRTATLKDKDGNIQKIVGVMVNIDRAKKSEQQLTERASYDALTELYNRETIEAQIDNEISLSEMRKSEMAVLFIDVDDFKHYNDNYSHATGDQVLKFLAKTIKEAVDGIGFAGRYGGDEFIMMIRNAEVNDPAQIAQKLIDKLSDGFDADVGERLSVSVSIGIAVIKDDYNTRVEYLIGKADDAMYSVKKSGKSNYAFI